MAKKKREIVQDKEETPWEKFLNIHKDKTVYQIYQLALISQVKPDIEPPTKPDKRRTREEIALIPTKTEWETYTQEEKDAFLELKKSWRKN